MEKVYQSLLEEHRTLQTNYDDVVAEKDDSLSRLRDMAREVEDKRNEKADTILRTEIDRLRVDLWVADLFAFFTGLACLSCVSPSLNALSSAAASEVACRSS